MNLLKMADMQQIDVIIKIHKWGWIGHTISCKKMSLQWPDKLCNEILWLVLPDEREDTTRREMKWKGVLGSKQNLV